MTNSRLTLRKYWDCLKILFSSPNRYLITPTKCLSVLNLSASMLNIRIFISNSFSRANLNFICCKTNAKHTRMVCFILSSISIPTINVLSKNWNRWECQPEGKIFRICRTWEIRNHWRSPIIRTDPSLSNRRYSRSKLLFLSTLPRGGVQFILNKSDIYLLLWTAYNMVGDEHYWNRVEFGSSQRNHP